MTLLHLLRLQVAFNNRFLIKAVSPQENLSFPNLLLVMAGKGGDHCMALSIRGGFHFIFYRIKAETE